MPSQAFLKYQNEFPAGPPTEDGPGGSFNPGGPIGGPGIPEEYDGLGVPMLPPDYEPPEPTVPAGFTGGKVTIGGVNGLHITRAGTKAGACHLYIHGGGFTLGSAMTAGETLAHFLEETGLEGYAVEYRLAPYHKFPAAVEDCLAFYKGLLAMGYETIVVGGESAGAGLTLSLTHALKMEHLPLPKALWCASPVDDMCYDQRELYKTDMFVDSCEGIRKAYVGDADPTDPRISPIYGDFTGFPPMFIQAGGGESLAAGAIRIVQKAAKANCEVLLHFGQDMPHTFAMDYKFYPEARNAMKEFTTFIVNTLELY